MMFVQIGNWNWTDRNILKMILILIEILSFINSGLGTTDYHILNETQLRTDIITTASYSNKIRPADLVEISVRLNILTLNELNTRTQTLELTGWLTTTWNDTRLSWNKENYGNISFIFETESVFWRPLLFVDNSVGSMSMITDDDLLLRAKYTGEIMWEPPAIYHTHCEIITTYYPFDVQHCYIELVSWAYTIDEVILKHMASEINLEDYLVNGEWDLLSTSLDTKQLIDGHEIFSQLEFIIKLRRRSMFYVLNVILPIMLTSFLSLLIFLLPHDSGEKISYSLTVLLAYAVLLTLISDNMPSTSHHVSVLSVYLCLILFVGALSVLLTVLSLHLYHQPAEKPIPKWIRKVVLGFMLKVTGYDVLDERGHKKRLHRKLGNKERVHPEMTAEDISIKGNQCGTDSPALVSRSNTDMAWQTDISHDIYSWFDLAKIFDCFFFRIYLVTVIIITLVCLLILIIGGYIS